MLVGQLKVHSHWIIRPSCSVVSDNQDTGAVSKDYWLHVVPVTGWLPSHTLLCIDNCQSLRGFSWMPVGDNGGQRWRVRPGQSNQVIIIFVFFYKKKKNQNVVLIRVVLVWRVSGECFERMKVPVIIFFFKILQRSEINLIPWF